MNLEPGDVGAFAREDPRGFLARFDAGAVIDEIQHAPELTSYLQEGVDRDPAPGRFILTGSENLQPTASVSRSPAGRGGTSWRSGIAVKRWRDVSSVAEPGAAARG